MKNKLIKLLILIISISFIFILTVYLLDVRDRINEGKFRINDFIVTSKANIDEISTKQENEKLEKLSDYKLNVSQTNSIKVLIAKLEDVEIDSIKVKVKNVSLPLKYEKFVIYQDDNNILDCKKDTIIDLKFKEEQEQTLIEFNINNINLLKEVVIPDGVNSIRYDGTILKTFGITLKDITFKIELELIVLDKNGKQNICNIKLNLPEQFLIDDGISYVREDLKKLNFKVK
jgi:hypothetical protein